MRMAQHAWQHQQPDDFLAVKQPSASLHSPPQDSPAGLHRRQGSSRRGERFLLLKFSATKQASPRRLLPCTAVPFIATALPCHFLPQNALCPKKKLKKAKASCSLPSSAAVFALLRKPAFHSNACCQTISPAAPPVGTGWSAFAAAAFENLPWSCR